MLGHSIEGRGGGGGVCLEGGSLSSRVMTPDIGTSIMVNTCTGSGVIKGNVFILAEIVKSA